MNPPHNPDLPPPEPRDPPATRPPLDLVNMTAQVIAIQTMLAEEREKKKGKS